MKSCRASHERVRSTAKIISHPFIFVSHKREHSGFAVCDKFFRLPKSAICRFYVLGIFTDSISGCYSVFFPKSFDRHLWITKTSQPTGGSILSMMPLDRMPKTQRWMCRSDRYGCAITKHKVSGRLRKENLRKLHSTRKRKNQK